MEFQLSPPGNHRALPSEQAIQTWKNHLTSVLYGVDDCFPANQWDQIVEPSTKILNMLWASRINPNLSAYPQVWGNFDYNKTHLAPLGYQAIIYKDLDTCCSQLQHRNISYFIGPCEHHYQQYKIYIPETWGEQTGDTVVFFPQHVQMPKTSSQDQLAAALEDLKVVIQDKQYVRPTLDQGSPYSNAIHQIEDICTPNWDVSSGPSPRVNWNKHKR